MYAARQHQTRVIADAIARRLRSHGLAVEIGDASAGTMPPPQDYDLVVLGSPMTFGLETRLIARYVEDNRAALVDVPSALFTVSDSGTLRDHVPSGFLDQFSRALDWHADLAAAFAGGEPHPREGMILRLVTWMRSTPPRDNAAFRTAWTDVQQFADTIATELAGAAVTADRTEPHVIGQAR